MIVQRTWLCAWVSISLALSLGGQKAQAQAVAAAIAQEAFYHVAYVAGTFETLLRPTASK